MGVSFAGCWSGNLFEGAGVHHWEDGRSFSGHWASGSMHGFGISTWRDGRRHQGMYEHDNMAGFGTYLWPNGYRFEGFFRNSCQHGHGLIRGNGKAVEGMWQDGQREWMGPEREDDNVTQGDAQSIADSQDCVDLSDFTWSSERSVPVCSHLPLE